MKITESAGISRPCEKCTAEVAQDLLVCPACGALMNAARLNELAALASQAAQHNDPREEIGYWREALTLLPEGSVQHNRIRERVLELSRFLDSHSYQAGETTASPGRSIPPPPPPPPTVRTAPAGSPLSPPPPNAAKKSDAPPAKTAASRAKGIFGGIAAVGVIFLKFFAKSKALVYLLFGHGKLLLAGLKSGSTFITMFLSFAVYWSLWSWKFALGLVLCVYVHEMGHVWAFRKLGIKSSWPMFVPGLGAFVRGKEMVADEREDARVGLAGPMWGAGASIICLAMFLLTGGGIWAAICRVNAWINLVNLVPFYPLDGGRGYRALSRLQGMVIAAAFGIAWGVSHDGVLLLLAIVAIIMAFRIKGPTLADKKSFWQYLALIALLTALLMVPVPGVPPIHKGGLFPE